ncbi:FAD-dependent monooxygenase [Pelagibacterium halotolerans]|uniref:2-octaprenyl-6-methoxyphenol hydroxylase n=1 Tax=Pelagibacterium halotolerans (strain DSM 22347 / JCM 15775 / CGMCC 1.7692 / B2) TaxID=1082931 RepID=G4R7N9_PELHB|nr:FAD-dependent monooxygenase [Pelagibacterium halotolerans]AEQ53299.1 2-octaprenyl-6-methoxyphenol hydroxylase [Pelagibacterium halotolerans B2]QJR17085.1 2-octaprenyl-6-methoxyphenyl hydroxylase [Pelagibacterium halotolerans]
MMAGSDQVQSFDILVVGGGPVGLSLAIALARFVPGINVGLLDRRALAVPRDSRASAIAAGVKHLFEAIGAWDGMAGAANPIAQMKITDSGSGDISRPVFLDFSGPKAPGEPFAHMVPNTASAASLIAAARNLVTIVEPGTVSAFSAGPAIGRIDLEDGRSLSAGLIVAADGGKSTLRGLAGIRAFSRDYRQSGLVTTIGHALPHHDVAYEHFRPAGPFASLPLAGNRSSLVWTEKPQAAQALVAMAPSDLAQRIEVAMGSVLGSVEIIETVQSFPLSLVLARRLAAPRLALVGDAAHVIHPLAGQGLNLGLRDVAVLAEVLVDAVRLGEDLGSMTVLERYERRRRADTALMACATDGLNRLFSNDVAPVRAARDFGLSLVNRIDPLKDTFMSQAAGQAGAKLLRGIPL